MVTEIPQPVVADIRRTIAELNAAAVALDEAIADFKRKRENLIYHVKKLQRDLDR